MSNSGDLSCLQSTLNADEGKGIWKIWSTYPWSALTYTALSPYQRDTFLTTKAHTVVPQRPAFTLQRVFLRPGKIGFDLKEGLWALWPCDYRLWGDLTVKWLRIGFFIKQDFGLIYPGNSCFWLWMCLLGRSRALSGLYLTSHGDCYIKPSNTKKGKDRRKESLQEERHEPGGDQAGNPTDVILSTHLCEWPLWYYWLMVAMTGILSSHVVSTLVWSGPKPKLTHSQGCDLLLGSWHTRLAWMLYTELCLVFFLSQVRLEEQLDKNHGYRKVIERVMTFNYISGREEMSTHRKMLMVEAVCHT